MKILLIEKREGSLLPAAHRVLRTIGYLPLYVRDINSYKVLDGELALMTDYLLAHEGDIAAGINDFGELKDVFVKLFDREPEGN